MLFCNVHELPQVVVMLQLRCSVHNEIVHDSACLIALLQYAVHLKLKNSFAHTEAEGESTETVATESCLECGQLFASFVQCG